MLESNRIITYRKGRREAFVLVCCDDNTTYIAACFINNIRHERLEARDLAFVKQYAVDFVNKANFADVWYS